MPDVALLCHAIALIDRPCRQPQTWVIVLKNRGQDGSADCAVRAMGRGGCAGGIEPPAARIVRVRVRVHVGVG